MDRRELDARIHALQDQVSALLSLEADLHQRCRQTRPGALEWIFLGDQQAAVVQSVYDVVAAIRAADAERQRLPDTALTGAGFGYSDGASRVRTAGA